MSDELFEEERKVAAAAISSANLHCLMALLLIPIGAIVLGVLWGTRAHGEDAVPAGALGAVVGGFLPLMYYFRARSAALDLRRRQMYMDRN